MFENSACTRERERERERERDRQTDRQTFGRTYGQEGRQAETGQHVETDGHLFECNILILQVENVR